VILKKLPISKSSFWFDNWKGYESEIEYKLDCALPLQAHLTLLQYFNDKKLILLWKNGFLVRDNMCDILLSFTATEGATRGQLV
jgi:hypothetical protein